MTPARHSGQGAGSRCGCGHIGLHTTGRLGLSHSRRSSFRCIAASRFCKPEGGNPQRMRACDHLAPPAIRPEECPALRDVQSDRRRAPRSRRAAEPTAAAAARRPPPLQTGASACQWPPPCAPTPKWGCVPARRLASRMSNSGCCPKRGSECWIYSRQRQPSRRQGSRRRPAPGRRCSMPLANTCCC